MSKKRWNRCISILMVAVMLLTVFVGTGINAAAEESSVELTIRDELLMAGATYTAAEYNLLSNVAVVSGNCTVESIKWQEPSGDEMQEDARFSDKNEYKVYITLEAVGSDTFDANATVTVNGSDEAVSIVNRHEHNSYSKLELIWTFNPMVKESIYSFDFSDIPHATPGAVAAPYSYIYTVAGEDKYTVTGIWHQYNSSTQQYESMADTAVFQDDGAYQLLLKAQMKPGYVIDEENPLYVTVDGRWVNVEYFDEFEWKASLYESFGTEIHEVRFTVPKLVEGQSFSDAAPITAAVSSGSSYTVKGNWMEEDTGSYTGTFTKGKAYHFAYTVYADDGYYLAENVEIYVNGTWDRILSGNGKTGSGMYRKSMKTPITEVALTNVPKAELGKPLQMEEFAITVPNGAKYKATGCWRESGNPITNVQVEAGKKYELDIQLQADSGYEFAEKYILRINGAAHQGYGGMNLAYYPMEYSFLEQIRQIEVNGVVEPVVGKAPNTASLKSADPTKYDIINKYWLDVMTGTTPTVFEQGHTYHLIVEVEAKPGYEFAPNSPWKLGENSGTTEPHTESWCFLFAEYSFATVVPEIRINNIPAVKVGEMPRTDITVPADANYTANAEWRVWDDQTEFWKPLTEAFEKDKNYLLSISVESKAGYRFDSDVTACYLDGVLNKKFTIDTLNAWGTVEYAAQGAKVISKVDVTVSKPVAKDHSSVEPVITLPDGANYRLHQDAMWLEGSIEENRHFNNRYFAEDGSYGVRLQLIADEGYVFAEDLVVVVNGIVLSAEAFSSEVKTMDTDYFFNMTCQHIEGNATTCAKKAVCAVCGQEYGELAAHTYENGKCTVCEAADPNYVLETDSPQTDDNRHMSVWVALLFVSGFGLVGTTLYGKKKFFVK